MVKLEYCHPLYGHRRAAIVHGVGEIWYLDEREFPDDVAERMLATGEWRRVSGKCKHVKLNDERCEASKMNDSPFCALHKRMYAPGGNPDGDE